MLFELLFNSFWLWLGVVLGIGGGAGAIFLLRSLFGLIGSTECKLGDCDDLLLRPLLTLPTLLIELFDAKNSLSFDFFLICRFELFILLLAFNNIGDDELNELRFPL